MTNGTTFFYIFAAVEDQPYHCETLCTFGITSNGVRRRKSQHERWLSQRRIDTSLELCFLATGDIITAESAVKRDTYDRVPNGFGRQMEWRCCHPRDLAALAVKSTLRSFSEAEFSILLEPIPPTA